MDITTHGDENNATASIIVGSEVWSINVDKELSDRVSSDADTLARDLLAFRLVLQGLMAHESWMPDIEGDPLDVSDIREALQCDITLDHIDGRWVITPIRDTLLQRSPIAA